MSLIAAVAVTGMTSTVCAQPLEEAIKGVDVSGMLRYRYNDKIVETAGAAGAASTTATTQGNEYTMKVLTKAKVNDMVTANVQVEALGVSDISSSDAHATSDATGDRDVTLSVTKANFAANLGVATVIAGKQSVPSPFVDNSGDDVTRGTGAVALIPVAGMTVAAGHFVNLQVAETAINLGNSIDALAVLGKVADVSFDAWYVNVNGVTGGLKDTTGTTLGAKAAVAGINLDFRTSKITRTGENDSGLTKLVASTKLGAASVVAGIAMTPKDNTQATIDTDNDAQSGFRLWQASTEKLNNSTAYLLGAKMEVIPGVTLGADYVAASADVAATSTTTGVVATAYYTPGVFDATTGVTGAATLVPVSAGTTTTVAAQTVDVSELLLTATYAMSKNFTVHARYSMMSTDYSGTTKDVDSNMGRLELKYTF